jgi:hypothetical protein
MRRWGLHKQKMRGTNLSQRIKGGEGKRSIVHHPPQTKSKGGIEPYPVYH